MPELPDVTIYVECLERLVAGKTLERLRVTNPFVLRTVEPAPDVLAGRRVVRVSRLGKRVVLKLEEELFIVIHLMIAGRLRWRKPGTASLKRGGLAVFEFTHGVSRCAKASGMSA